MVRLWGKPSPQHRQPAGSGWDALGWGGSWPGVISEQSAYLGQKQLLWGVDTRGSEGSSTSGSVMTGAARTNRSRRP